MNLEELKEMYALVARANSNDQEMSAFAGQLIESDAPEVVEYHFELLRDRRNESLFRWLRNAFAKRGASGERFLLMVVDRERSPQMHATILHILGRMQSGEAREMARRALSSTHVDLRHVAAYVLGWVGPAEDIDVLGDVLMNDADSTVRADAATAQYQIVSRVPDGRERAIEALGRALRQESNNDVLTSILISLQDIAEKRFGMHEDVDEGTISGNVDKARHKALRFLDERKS